MRLRLRGFLRARRLVVRLRAVRLRLRGFLRARRLVVRLRAVRLRLLRRGFRRVRRLAVRLRLRRGFRLAFFLRQPFFAASERFRLLLRRVRLFVVRLRAIFAPFLRGLGLLARTVLLLVVEAPLRLRLALPVRLAGRRRALLGGLTMYWITTFNPFP